MNGFYKNKKVLIIGGTGTIGQGLLEQILKDEPAVVRILSRDEHKQFLLQQRMRQYDNIRYLIGDVRSLERVIRAMESIDYVFHVAAMKHVPSCEYNPYEAVQTNIIGTQNVIRAAIETGIKKVVFTSTDKAIAPTNTYGATKLMAERLIANAQYNSGAHETDFSVVRFGNVIGSRGSVVPLFFSQIQRERAVYVTDIHMTRFMMTLNQATSLTLKSMQQSRGGEIFVLKMPVIRLSDLVQVVIEKATRILNINPEAIKIHEIGLRPGEKMFEELMTIDESNGAWELPDMFVIPNPLLERSVHYDSANTAEIKMYSSHDEEPISIDSVRTLLEREFFKEISSYEG
ncbi:polysaccharide biosynthesis protein [Paenibacillus sp. HJGM_3]|uniref:polysaccharide biosynthesis protein n=1 Tax=Paenibacillus sp. HJGM_3 TaxID=3379816 RepID=UPI00385B9937